jgi:nucleotide-binding universal stress UspA family protein
MTENTTHQSLAELRVVVGDDGSQASRRAVAFAAHEAARRGALLEIVCAYCLPTVSMCAIVPTDSLREATEQHAAAAAAYAHEVEPDVVVKTSVSYGPPGSQLVVASTGADLLVVGTRGHGELAGVLLGSVSSYVVHHALCPVTVVR